MNADRKGMPQPDLLALVDSVSRVLARRDLSRPAEGYGAALGILAERFDALMLAVLRFRSDGARVEGVWTPERYESDPRLELSLEDLPPASPLRTTRRAMIFEFDAFGPAFGSALREFGGDSGLLVTPIVDGEAVDGCLAMLAEGATDLGDDERVAIQLCGELLWRHMRHTESARELRERAEGAEVLTRIGGLLQEAGIADARDVLDEILGLVGARVEASDVTIYERESDAAVPIAAWSANGEDPRERAELGEDQWSALSDGPLPFGYEDLPDLAATLLPGRRSGVITPGVADGRLVGALTVGRRGRRPLRPTEVELVSGVMEALGQFRARIVEELALVRQGVVEQTRSEIAESFIRSPPSAVDDAALVALQRVGEVFRARRVRWILVDDDEGDGRSVLEWQDGSASEAPRRWSTSGSPVRAYGQGAPFVLSAAEVRDLTGMEAAAPTIVVPAVSSGVSAALTLTGEGLDRALPDDEWRALTDLARLIHQARLRAQSDLEREYRQRIDDLQVRIATRFLDRSVVDHQSTLRWALAEVGETLGADLLAFAEYVGTADGEIHWWSRGGRADRVKSMMDVRGDEHSRHFQDVLEAGEPAVTRSVDLAEPLRGPLEEVIGSEFAMVVVPVRAPGIALLLGAAVLHDREWSAMEVGFLQHLVAQSRQFIDVVDSRNRLEYDASHDSLTGLANRRRITEAFESEIAQDRSGAILMIDVDRFKVVNDSLGHSAGDQVLVAIAERIRGVTRAADLVARFGGDEFAVLVRDDTGDLELAAAAQRLIDVIRAPIDVRGSTVIPTCSIGIARRGSGDDVESVLRHADAALYVAKAQGRDRYEFFDDANRQDLSDRLHLETSLRRGVTEGEFIPWYQPEYDLETGEIVGLEALVRWQHPTEGVLEAAQFIETAEEIGLAPELSRLVINSSFAMLREWIDTGFDTRLRVNVAAAQLQTDELAGHIGEALERHRIPADRVCIEITERSLMLDPDGAVETLVRVRDLGVEVAIDDFGTGFSSLARLKHLPVDTLKIDRSFVRGILTSETDREIVRTIIWLCRGLGLDVVAEGVEEPGQVDALRELGCRRAQGWLWSAAVPASDVRALVLS